MKLFVPACGDRITLTKPWKFNLTLERRNHKFAETKGFIEIESSHWRAYWNKDTGYKKVEVTLPKGTVLECDRVYIRVFSKAKAHDDVDNDFDSITWKMIGKNGKGIKNCRFWAKLSEFNEFNFKLYVDSKFRDRIKSVREVVNA